MRLARSRGFTLLELLVVLAVLAMITGLVGPAVNRWRVAAEDRGWRADLEAALRAEPVLAFRAGAPLSLSAEALRAQLHDLPADVRIELDAPLQYNAVGQAEGGVVRAGRAGQALESWRIEPVSGDVARLAAEAS